MTQRAPFLELATYRRRRNAACKAIRQRFDAALPILVLGTPLTIPPASANPLPAANAKTLFDWFCGREPDSALLIDPSQRLRDTLFLDPGDPSA